MLISDPPPEPTGELVNALANHFRLGFESGHRLGKREALQLLRSTASEVLNSPATTPEQRQAVRALINAVCQQTGLEMPRVTRGGPNELGG